MPDPHEVILEAILMRSTTKVICRKVSLPGAREYQLQDIVCFCVAKEFVARGKSLKEGF